MGEVLVLDKLERAISELSPKVVSTGKPWWDVENLIFSRKNDGLVFDDDPRQGKRLYKSALSGVMRVVIFINSSNGFIKVRVTLWGNIIAIRDGNDDRCGKPGQGRL